MILRTCISLLLLFALTDLCNAQENRFRPQGSQIPGPRGNSPQPGWLTEMQGWTRERPSEFQSWLEDIKAWRAERLIRIGYNDAEYRRPEFAWTQGNLVAPQVMVEDRYLYDSAAGKFTVDRYLADLRRRYGGIDAVLVWPVYPNLGIDDRNLGVARSAPDFSFNHVRGKLSPITGRSHRVQLFKAPLAAKMCARGRRL